MSAVRERSRDQRGATLIELLLVVAIAGLIAAPVASWVISTLRSQDVAKNVLVSSVSTGRLANVFSKDIAGASQVLVDNAASDCDGGGPGAGDVVLSLVPSSQPGRVVYTEAPSSDRPGIRSVWRRVCDQAGFVGESTELFARIVPSSSAAACLGAGDATGDCADEDGAYPRVRLGLTVCPASPVQAAAACDPTGGTTEDVELHARRRVTPGYEQYANQGPIAQVQVSPRVGYLTTSFSFDASASRGIDEPGSTVEWEFPDGQTSNQVNVQRTFGTAGDHEVRLRITDSQGRTNQAVARVRVIHRFPRAVATTTGSGSSVVFVGTGSSHPDGLALEYYWDFGGGILREGPTVPNPFPPDATGRRRAVLTVHDDLGGTDSATVIVDFGTPSAGPITIDPVPVEVAGKLPTVGSVGPDLDPLQVTFTGAAGSEGLGWRLTRHGSGEVVATGPPGAGFAHTFGPEGNGDFEIVRVDSSDNPLGEAVAFRVNAAPRAQFELTVAAAGSATSFRADGSSDPDGPPDGSNLSYRWWFQDPTAANPDATGRTPSFIYTSPGTYLVVLEVTDDDGQATRATRLVQIPGTPAPPPPPRWNGDRIDWGGVVGAERYRVTVMCTVGAPFVTEAEADARSATVPAGFCGGGVATASLQVRAGGNWSQPSAGVDR